MRQVREEVERENGIDQQPDEPETGQTKQTAQHWIQTILLNLVVAASICMARAAMDYLVEGYGNYRHDQREYVRDGYPF